MPVWMKRIRGVLGMGLLWGAVWGLVGGGLMEGLVDPAGRILDMWPQVLAIVGFIGGVGFAGAVMLRGERRGLGRSSFAEFGALGAAAGVVQGLIAMALVGAPALFLVVTITGSTLGGIASLAVARMAGRRELSSGASGGAITD